jgi:Ca2+-binding RTX toxin-like protein
MGKILVSAIAVTVLMTSAAALGASKRNKPSTGTYTADVLGTAGNDMLSGSDSANVIDGRNGGDFIDGAGGNDILIGGNGADAFVLRSGGGNDVIVDFNPIDQGDRLLFDFGTYSDYMVFGPLEDGMQWSNFMDTALFTVHAIDVNSDGSMDTVIQVNDDSITILNFAPNMIWGQWLRGG